LEEFGGAQSKSMECCVQNVRGISDEGSEDKETRELVSNGHKDPTGCYGKNLATFCPAPGAFWKVRLKSGDLSYLMEDLLNSKAFMLRHEPCWHPLVRFTVRLRAKGKFTAWPEGERKSMFGKTKIRA
jgi:hypothetical protein